LSLWTACEQATEHLRLLRSDPDWSVRVGLRHRALATEVDEGLLWFGSHADYDAMIGR